MDSKIQIFKIAKTGYEDECKLLDGVEVAYKIFWPMLIYTTINIISEKIFFSKWNVLVPVFTYLFLLFGLSFSVMWHRNKSGGKFKLSEVEILEVIKIVLAANSVYFYCVSIKDNVGDALIVLAMHVSLYLGFTISLNKLLRAEQWEDILEGFKEALPQKRFIVTMVVMCVFFGSVGFYSEKIIFPVLVIMLVVFFSLLFAFLLWRQKPFKSMHAELKSRCEGKRTLILHAGMNYAFCNIIKKEIEFFEEVDSLENSINKYDIVVVINTFYDDAMRGIITDNIGRVLKTDGIIVDLFVGKNKRRKRFCAWLGVPRCWSEFHSIDTYCNMY